MGFINKTLLPILFSLCLLAVTFIGGLELVIFNEGYFEWHYTNRHITKTTGMSVSELMSVTHKMLDYLKNQRDNLDMQALINGHVEEVFGEREKNHMIDVKALYIGARNIRRMAGISAVMILLYGWFFNKNKLYSILKRIKYYVPAMLAIIAIVGGLFATDFNRYFTLFHEMFFDNDLWLLNPKTDILINMVPESYFYSVVMIGLGIFLVLTVTAVILAEIGARKLVERI